MDARGVNKWLITASVMIPTLIEILDTSIANVALQHIQGSLSAGQDEATWVLTSYLVSNAIVIPMSGWLARLMGRKRYLLASISLFTAASMLCGMATSLPMLIFFRVVQGIGGGGLQPVAQAILLESFPPRQRGLAMAIYAMGAVLGPILGPLLGGWITDSYSWRWIFYINVPMGLIALAMNWTYVQDPHYLERRVRGEKIDYIGLSLLTIGLGCLQIVLDKGQQDDWFASNFITGLTAVSIVSLVILVFWELAHDQPIIDLRAFKDRSFAAGNLVMFFGFFAFFGSIVLLPLYLQTLMGYTALLAGIVLGPSGAIMLLILPFVGRLTQKIDARFILAFGLLVSAYSLHFMAGFSLNIDIGTAILARNIQAIGISCFFVPLSYLTMSFISREKMTNASAIFSLLRNLGGSFGVAFVTTLLARRAQFHQARLVDHLTPFDPIYVQGLHTVRQYLDAKLGPLADHTTLAAGYIYQIAQQQAASLAFLDVFHAQALMFLGLSGFMWIMRSPKHGAEPPASH